MAIAVIWLHLFNDSYGPVNQILRPILALVHLRPPNWFGVDVSANPPINDAARWAVPGLVIMGLWGVGGGMIIYLAGLKGIPESLYEAATIDGAGPMRRFWNVTLPMLSPLIFYNVVMGIIASFQIFTQAYVMTGPGPDNATLLLRAESVPAGIRVSQHGVCQRHGVGVVCDRAGGDGGCIQGVEESGVLRGVENMR